MLAGTSFPSVALESTLRTMTGKVTASKKVRVINQTPYEGHMERTCLKFHKNPDMPRIATLSVTTDAAVNQFTEQAVAIELMEDDSACGVMMEWKKESALLAEEPNYKKYEKDPVSLPSEVRFEDFQFKIVTAEKDSNAKGVQKYKFGLKPEIRKLYMQDPLHSQEWAELITSFDAMYGCSGSPAAVSATTASSETAATKPGYPNEPKTVDALNKEYDTEFKLPGRHAGTTLFITKACNKQGEEKVAHNDVTVPSNEFIIAHGRSVFIKHEKALQAQREGSAGPWLGRSDMD
ncbi:unnamed protein product [Symbiodinium sp. CCMP2592]|nr:unnamed protein product [Symbiodinium sp. CCMP2592]